MKKFFGIAAVAALFLMASLFTGCSQPYTGRYWVTEYISGITETEFNTCYTNATSEEKTAWRTSWSTLHPTTYEKKSKLKTNEVAAYLKSKMDITDAEIEQNLADIGTKWRGMYYEIDTSSTVTPYNMLYLTEAK